jgi:radical SAM protein with 4Fe4S-binding SPASM domain
MLPQGIEFLENRGIRHFVPSLDLWTRWTKYDLGRLEEALVSCSEVWWAGLPNCSITWFDEKLAHLTGVGASPTARCGFGNGEVAISAAGYLYPCERLIGEDAPDNPLRLPGHVLQGTDFCPQPAPGRDAEGCSACAIRSFCSTTCRCSNYIRTGDVRRPDGLLCLLDRVCCRETARRLQEPQVPQLPAMPQFQDRAETERKEMHYAE